MRDNYNCSSSPKNFDDSKSAGGQLESVSGSGETKLCVAKLPTTYNESCYRSARAVIRSNAPPRNVFFVGRTNYLETLRHCLSSPGQICVLSGEAGVGKTATAIEYSYKYENDLSHVFWIDAETSGGCADTYSLIASVRNRLVQGVDVLRDQNSLNHQVRKALEFTKHRWLLVFDNVKSVSTVEPYIPRGLQNTQGSVLLIARIDTLLDCPSRLRSCQALRLGAMRLDESRELLLCSVDSDADRQNLHLHRDHDRAADVARLMDGLPLSINMAAGYLRQSNCTLAEFIDIWKEWQSWSTETTQGLEAGSIISSLDILWKIEIRELPKEERHLLEILSFLDPEVIQKDLLVGNHKELALQFLNPVETNRYRRMVKNLSGRRLVTITDKNGIQTLSIHRLLQLKIRRDLVRKGSVRFARVFDKAYCLVRKMYPPASPIQAPEPLKWRTCKMYLPHVLSLWHAFTSPSSPLKPRLELATLFYDAGFHAWEQQVNIADGIRYLETAEAMLNDMGVDEDAKLRADIHCILAISFESHGPRKDMAILHRRTEAMRIRTLIHEADLSRESDVLLTNSRNDYGLSLLGSYHFDEAGRIFEACYERYCCWGSEEQIPFEYAKYYTNIARVKMWQGNFQDAIRLCYRGVELFEQAVGHTWKVFLSQFILAYILLQSGDLQGALDLHLQICGKYDFTTVSSCYAVGAMYHYLGDLSAARYVILMHHRSLA
ncbi:P-loop containing nucleoside triphosphate hydrolase protein [Leptodontidium sp. MPI-SDFR-AT-0119]|nr:P-loop containing nucleoside triphosphate hydrolase protein [Leptodontidium sp. MPI-SDFR-AT-0119]